MRSFRLAVFAGAIALSVGMSGCSTIESLLPSTSSTTVAQANTAAAAEQAYTQLANLEVVYAKSGAETKAQAAVIKALDQAVYADVVAARTAVANNDNVALATALQLFNQAQAALATYLTNAKGGGS
jgi:hypothetical protein